jgi:hypothetical protein
MEQAYRRQNLNYKLLKIKNLIPLKAGKKKGKNIPPTAEQENESLTNRTKIPHHSKNAKNRLKNAKKQPKKTPKQPQKQLPKSPKKHPKKPLQIPRNTCL